MQEAELREAVSDFLDRRPDLRERHPRAVRDAIRKFVGGEPGLRWALEPADRPGLAARPRVGAPGVGRPSRPDRAAVRARRRARLRPSPSQAREARPRAAQPGGRGDGARLAALEDHLPMNLHGSRPGQAGAVQEGDDQRDPLPPERGHAPPPEAGRPRRREDDPLRALALPERPAAGAVRKQLRRQPRELHGRLHRQDFLGVEPRLHQRDRLPADSRLIKDGCRDELAFKDYLRLHQVPTLVWHPAYGRLSTANVAANERLRKGLHSGLTASAGGSRRCDPRARRHPGLFARGYSNLSLASFVLLGFEDGGSGRSWLGDALAGITTSEDRPERRAVNVAFTASGSAVSASTARRWVSSPPSSSRG